MKKRFRFLNIFSLVLFVLLLRTHNAHAITVDYSSLGIFQTPLLYEGDITVTGSADIYVTEGIGGGLGIVGGISDKSIDGGGGLEYISFLFDTLATDVIYHVIYASDTDGDFQFGESFLTVFGSANEILGFFAAAWFGFKDVSALVGDVPISRFTVTSDVDIIRIKQVNYNPVPLPGAIWLFGSSLAGLVAVRRRKK